MLKSEYADIANVIGLYMGRYSGEEYNRIYEQLYLPLVSMFTRNDDRFNAVNFGYITAVAMGKSETPSRPYHRYETR